MKICKSPHPGPLPEGEGGKRRHGEAEDGVSMAPGKSDQKDQTGKIRPRKTIPERPDCAGDGESGHPEGLIG